MFLTDKNIIVLNEVDSTNNYAKQLIRQKVEDGTVVLAHYQDAGRGQVGNFWESEAKRNLLFSMIVFPGFLEAAKQFYISKVVSLSLVDLLESRINSVCIKWPNDMYWGEKKIAGMLIENSIKGVNLDSSVVGVGLNVNQEIFLSDAPNPISMKQITGKDFKVEDLLKEFLGYFDAWFVELKNEHYEKIDKAYFSHLFRNEGWHKFRRKGEDFEARISGIGDFGQLKLEQKSGEVLEFMFKEVEFAI